MQLPRVGDRAHHVVAPVHDHRRDPREPLRAGQQRPVGEERVVDEVVVLDPCEGEREAITPLTGVGPGEQGRGPRLPRGPRARRGDGDLGVLVVEQAVVRRDVVVARRRDRLLAVRRDERGEVSLPLVGEQVRGLAAVEPVDLHGPAQEDPAQHEFGHPLGMGLGVGEPEGGAPGSAEHLPALDAEVLAHPLEVGDEMPRGVHPEVGAVGDVGRAPPTAPLVDEHDPVRGRVEHPPVRGGDAPAGPAVDEHDGLAVGVAAGLPVQGLPVADVEHPRGVRLGLRVRRAARCGLGPCVGPGAGVHGPVLGGAHRKLCPASGYSRERTSPA